jgi:hypothetical protein
MQKALGIVIAVTFIIVLLDPLMWSVAETPKIKLCSLPRG